MTTTKETTFGNWKEKILLFFRDNPEEFLSAADAGIKFGVPVSWVKEMLDNAHANELLGVLDGLYFANAKLRAAKPGIAPTKRAMRALQISEIPLEDDIPIPPIRSNRPVSPWETKLKSMRVGQSFETSIGDGRLAEKQAIKLKTLGFGRYTTAADADAGTMRVWRVA